MCFSSPCNGRDSIFLVPLSTLHYAFLFSAYLSPPVFKPVLSITIISIFINKIRFAFVVTFHLFSTFFLILPNSAFLQPKTILLIFQTHSSTIFLLNSEFMITLSVKNKIQQKIVPLKYL